MLYDICGQTLGSAAPARHGLNCPPGLSIVNDAEVTRSMRRVGSFIPSAAAAEINWGNSDRSAVKAGVRGRGSPLPQLRRQ